MEPESEQHDSPDAQERRWHANIGGKKEGPFNDAEMDRLAATGRLSLKTQVWKSGMPAWLPCASIPELARLIQNRQPFHGDPWAGFRPIISLIGKFKDGVFDFVRRRIGARHVAFLAIILALGASAWVWRAYFYTPPHDDLVSLFAAETSGVAGEIAKVEKRGPSYFLTQKQNGAWGTAEPVRPMKKKEFTELFGKEWREAKPAGLVNADGKTAILRVKEGWSNGEFTCATGYFLMRPSGPTQLTKTEVKTLALPSLAKKSPTPSPTTVEVAANLASGADKAGEESGAASPPEKESLPRSSEKMDALQSPEAEPRKNREIAEANPKGADKKVESSDSSQGGSGDEAAHESERSRTTHSPMSRDTEYPELPNPSRANKGENPASEDRPAVKTPKPSPVVAVKTKAVSLSSAQEKPPESPPVGKMEIPTAPKTIQLEAVKLERNNVRQGETIKAGIAVTNLQRRLQFRRLDSVLALQNGRYVEIAPPRAQDFFVDPPGGIATATFSFGLHSAPGLYRLHSSLTCLDDPAQPSLECDYDLEVTGLSNPLKGKSGRLGRLLDKVGEGLENLGVQVQVNP